MVMRFNVKFLDSWIAKNGPRAIEKLAVATGLSVSGIYKIRKEERLPKPETITKLAQAMDVDPTLLIIIENSKRRRAA